MKNDKIVDMYNSIKLSNDAKNRIYTKATQADVIKKNIKWQFAIAVLAALLLLSVAAYAAAPAIRRHFFTRVIEGEDFVTEFIIAEFDPGDGTTSVAMELGIDREAIEAADDGVIILEVDGEEWVYLDELHFDKIEDGLALLELENVRTPGWLPQGFSFSRFTFPVNPHNHQYRLGTIPTASEAVIYFTNDEDVIRIQMRAIPDGTTLFAGDDQQKLSINGAMAVLMGAILSDEELAKLDGVTLYDDSDDTLHFYGAFGGMAQDGQLFINMLRDGIMYGFFTESQRVTPFDFVKMAYSMQ